MKNFLVLQHTYSEYLGTIERQLETREIAFVYQRPFTGQDLLGSALQFDALWLLGGAYPITDRQNCPWIDDELRLIRAFKKALRPVVGIGFGGLLVAQEAGGTASENPPQRAYWTTARKATARIDDPLANAVHEKKVLVMVNGRVDLPAQITPIIVDEHGEWLAIRPDVLTYGMLFRPELKPGMIEDIIMESARPTPDNIAELLCEARASWVKMQRTTDAVCVALVAALDLMQERRKMPVFSLSVKSESRD